MIQKIKNYLAIAAIAFMPAVTVLVPTTVASAACSSTASAAGEGAGAALDKSGTGNSIDCNGGVSTSTGGIKKLAGNLVNIFSIVVGIAAVIMIIYGGFRYITSGGDSGSVGNAKNTLIYAIVGLIIVALAQVIVRFVLTASSDVQNP